MSTLLATTTTDPRKLVYALCHHADRLRVKDKYGQVEESFQQRQLFY